MTTIAPCGRDNFFYRWLCLGVEWRATDRTRKKSRTLENPIQLIKVRLFHLDSSQPTPQRSVKKQHWCFSHSCLDFKLFKEKWKTSIELKSFSRSPVSSHKLKWLQIKNQYSTLRGRRCEKYAILRPTCVHFSMYRPSEIVLDKIEPLLKMLVFITGNIHTFHHITIKIKMNFQSEVLNKFSVHPLSDIYLFLGGSCNNQEKSDVLKLLFCPK